MKRLQWYGCYRASWNAAPLIPDAYSHPAKVAFGLAERIYKHMLEQGYIKPGQIIVDPFGGIAGFAFHALRNGLHWKGVELEANFCELGRQNIELWNNRYAAHFPGWGTAEITQGDSRRLAAVLREEGGVVSSPPYAESLNSASNGIDWQKVKKDYPGRIIHEERESMFERHHNDRRYGSGSGQLGSMKEGDIAAVVDGAISSPPFSPAGNQPTGRGQGVRQDYKNGKLKESSPESDYGGSPGNLGNLPPGDINNIAAVTSPPYAEAVNGAGEGPGARFDHLTHRGENATKKSSANGYGQTEGNLGNLAAGAVTSPPYESKLAAEDMEFYRKKCEQTGRNPNSAHAQGINSYGASDNNIGNQTGPTFWLAAHQIMTELYAVLTPGGYAAFVCGDYVRDKKRVHFGRQWLQLCEAVGFEPVEWITAWKTEPGPIQAGIFEDKDLTIDRVSFFRRLANNRAIENGNEEAVILNEDILIVRKPVNKEAPIEP